MKILISASVITEDLSTPEKIVEAIKKAEQYGVDMLHIDVEDGVAAQQTTVWNDPQQLSYVRSDLPLDVHLMIQNPDERFIDYVHAGAKMIAFHIEEAKHPEVILSKLHRWHIKAGLAIKPETDVEKLDPYLPLIDYVLVLSVHPGPSGQPFIPEVLEKVNYLRRNYPDMPILIDGGMNPERASMAIGAGADIIVIGSGLFKAENPSEVIETIRSLN